MWCISLITIVSFTACRLDFLTFLCYTYSIRKLEKVSKLERTKMLVNKCKSCGWQTPELQDSFCPVCSDMSVRPRLFVRLEQDVRV